MAIGIHVAIIGLVNVEFDNSTVVYSKSTATLGQVKRSAQEPRILEDPDLPNTSGNPTIKQYLELEAAGDYVLRHIDQTYIITYEVSP